MIIIAEESDLKTFEARTCKHEDESVAIRNLLGVKKEIRSKDSIISRSIWYVCAQPQPQPPPCHLPADSFSPTTLPILDLLPPEGECKILKTYQSPITSE